MPVNKDQVTGVAERILYGLAVGLTGIGVKKGWYDTEMAAYLAGGIVTVVGSIWALWINRPTALIQSAANQPNTVVVTTADIAKATPETNIVSNTEQKVTPK
jgi:hypothetical protein